MICPATRCRPRVVPFLVTALAIAVLTSGCPRSVLLLDTCVLSGGAATPWDVYPFAGGCDPDIDFGMVAAGVTTSAVVAMHHDGLRDPLTVSGISIVNLSGAADAFTLSFFLSTGGASAVAATLPVALDPPDEETGVPPQVLYVQIDFDGSVSPFPSDQLVITSNDETLPSRTIDIVGGISDCMAGFLDCDGDPGNGCEIDMNDPTTCGTDCMALVDCEMEASVDTDGAPDEYETGGEVTDFTTCSMGACLSETYTDSCAGDVLTEYGTNGASYTMEMFDCTDLETGYCQTATELWRDVWSCSGTPGACVDEPDVLEADCATASGCVGVCGSGPNGCGYSDGTCTAGSCVGGSGDVDLDPMSCAGCSLDWAIGGDIAGTTCCGDDAGEYLTTCNDSSTNGACGGDTSACCANSGSCIDDTGACRTAGSCHLFGPGGLQSYCGSGTWEDPDESMIYCTATGCAFGWNVGGSGPGATACCGDDPGEYLLSCDDSSTNGMCGADTEACCPGASDCVDAAGDCQSGNACYLFGALGSYCNNGTWEDPDENASYCTASGCGHGWSVGGEVAATTCCGDDPGENLTYCDDSSDNGSCAPSIDACCDAASDCADANGDCRSTGACYVFTGGQMSYCNSGTWEDPDENMSYCTAPGCGYDWVSGGSGINSACCGDDAGEDFEGTSTCCYNGTYLADGSDVSSIMCSNGNMYDCGGVATDDSGLGTHDSLNQSRESHRCTDRDTWCPNGTTDCTSTTGCETTLNNNAGSCATATDFGTICAEELFGAPGNCFSRPCMPYPAAVDTGEAWFEFTAQLCSAVCSLITEVEVILVVPPDVDYDLYLYTGCGTLVDSSTGGTGVDETVNYSWPMGQTYRVEVRFASGVSCANWQLIILGGDCI